MGTTILASIMAIWQNKSGASYDCLTAKGSQAAFYLTFSLGLIILISYSIMFKLENFK